MQKLFTLFIAFIFGLTIHAQTTQVQFINNSADSIMRLVKVSMNGDLKKDSLTYRKATPFISTSGDSTYTILFESVRNSSKAVSVTQNLEAGKKYVFVLNGLTNDTTFQKNPDSVSVLLHIVVIDQSVLPVPAANQTTLAFVNGSTDAPAFDLYSNDGLNTLLVDNDSLNQALPVSLQDTILKLKLNTADGGFTISYFLCSLSNLGGQITTALTSGFFAPGSNQNGANFSIYIVDSSGNVIETPSVSLVENKNLLLEKLTLFPNPAVDFITLDYTLAESAPIRLSIFNVNGAMVADETVGLMTKGMHQTTVSIPELPGGVYFLRLQSALFSNTVRFIVQ